MSNKRRLYIQLSMAVLCLLSSAGFYADFIAGRITDSAFFGYGFVLCASAAIFLIIDKNRA